MAVQTIEEVKKELSRWLDDATLSPKDGLLGFIRAAEARYEQRTSAEKLMQELLARAASALGPLLTTWPRENIAVTEAAARRYLEAPTAAAFDAFCDAATASYPFGPGDGCFAIDELGGHGAPASGDAGFGFIWTVAAECGADVAMRALQIALGPALRP
jgi:hypothetical protein